MLQFAAAAASCVEEEEEGEVEGEASGGGWLLAVGLPPLASLRSPVRSSLEGPLARSRAARGAAQSPPLPPHQTPPS